MLFGFNADLRVKSFVVSALSNYAQIEGPHKNNNWWRATLNKLSK
jgi:hypothetical protein